MLGLRLNVWTSILVFAGALAYFLLSLRRHPGRLDYQEPGPEPETCPTTSSTTSAAAEAAEAAQAARADPADPPARP